MMKPLKEFLKRFPFLLSVNKLKKYCLKFGIKDGILAFRANWGKQGSILEINIKQLRNPLIIRRNTSDILVFEQIFLFDEYKINIEHSPKFIIDGGANVGYAAVYFANKYPDAKILAIEPEESNYELLQKNILPYKNIQSMQCALWNLNEPLDLLDKGFGEWGYITEKANDDNKGNLMGMTVDAIMKKYHFEYVDILKLDIEGAEKEVFKNNYSSWLGKVGILLIELHDRIIPGCSNVFYEAISNYDFSSFELGENMVFINRNLKFL